MTRHRKPSTTADPAHVALFLFAALLSSAALSILLMGMAAQALTGFVA